ncbi:aminotransferase class V-fold PLP-dependent enzyme [soil metagenome]|jgi:selenocysteine lyase/cysteine desulfurase
MDCRRATVQIMDLASAAAQFAPSGCYLNTATVGLPTRDALDALAHDQSRWARGQLDPMEYDQQIDRARQAYAQLVGATSSRVGIIGQVSLATGVAATAIRPGDQVVVAEEDFTSVLFPFLQRKADGVVVRPVPLCGLLDAVTPQTTMIAVSAVQSADGRVINLDDVARVAHDNDCLTYVDVTQAASWLRIGADRFSITACGAYKWLCSPRGTGFMTVDPAAAERFTPVAAGWYAGDDVWSSIYGPPLRLAHDGRRFDTSPAWSGWVGALPTLELLAAVGSDAIGAHDVALANRFRAGMQLPPSDSAIVSLDRDGAGQVLAEAGVQCAGRGGRTRVGFHLYNTAEDTDHALDALTS